MLRRGGHDWHAFCHPVHWEYLMMCDWRTNKINKQAGGVRERSSKGKGATIFIYCGFQKTHRGVVDAQHLHRQTWYQFTGGIRDHSQFHRTASIIIVNVPVHLTVFNISWFIMGAKDLVVRGPFSPAVNASMMGWPPA